MRNGRICLTRRASLVSEGEVSGIRLGIGGSSSSSSYSSSPSTSPSSNGELRDPGDEISSMCSVSSQGIGVPARENLSGSELMAGVRRGFRRGLAEAGMPGGRNGDRSGSSGGFDSVS